MSENNQQDEKSAKSRRERMFVLFWVLLVDVGAFALLVPLTGKFFGVGWSFLGLPMWGLLTYLLVYLVLADPVNNVCFLRIPESCAVIILHMGVIKKAVMRWMGYKINTEGKVSPLEDGEKLRNWARRIFGGLIWVGLYPLMM